MKLILEESLDIETVVELNEATGEKTYIIKGIFSTPELKNRNGRIYPMRIWEENVTRYQREIENNTQNTLMEKEHPPRTEVDPEKAVARIRKLEIREGRVYGESVIFNKPETKDIRERIDAGRKIGVSSRGVGKLNGDIVEEFTLITYDIVQNPSDWNANLDGFNESLILESVNIESNGHGGWICTPEGCTLAESRDITKEVKKRLKKEPVMVADDRGKLISLHHEDDGCFFGIDQFDNDVELDSLKGYIIAESKTESPCQKKAKELKEALEKIASEKDLTLKRIEEDAKIETFKKIFGEDYKEYVRKKKEREERFYKELVKKYGSKYKSISAEIADKYGYSMSNPDERSSIEKKYLGYSLQEGIKTKKDIKYPEVEYKKNVEDRLEELTKYITRLKKDYQDPISLKSLKKAQELLANAWNELDIFSEYEFGKDY